MGLPLVRPLFVLIAIRVRHLRQGHDETQDPADSGDVDAVSRTAAGGRRADACGDRLRLRRNGDNYYRGRTDAHKVHSFSNSVSINGGCLRRRGKRRGEDPTRMHLDSFD